MARIKVRREIEIERNIIERFLMGFKNTVKKYNKPIIYTLVGIFLIIAVIIFSLIYYENVSTSQQVEFEQIMEKYREYNKLGKEKDPKKLEALIVDLKKFKKNTYFGFPHKMSGYMLGNIYFSQNKYKESKEMLIDFADVSPSSIFSSISLVKAATAAEEMGDVEGALKILTGMEEEYGDSVVADQLFYNLAGIYGKKGDLFKSRQYYNKVATSFQQSPFSRKAKKRLFLLNSEVKK